MKVFISWSGPISREVAVALRDWLPSVIQAVEPYVSSEDIDPGVRWGVDIAGQLDDTEFGVLCVTRNNVTAPWLNFEAGALSKSVERSRVVPFLIDLSPSLDISRTAPRSLLTCEDGGDRPHPLVIALVEGSVRIVAGQRRCRVPFDNFVCLLMKYRG